MRTFYKYDRIKFDKFSTLMKILPLLILVSIMIACRGNAQQMASNSGNDAGLEQGMSVYQELDLMHKKIAADPSNADLRNSRALIYLKLNEFENALADIEAGISINANNDALYYTQSLIFLKRKRYDSALESITKAVELKASESNLFLRANIYNTRGETREAIMDLDAVLGMNPRCDYCYLQKALWCNDLNMFYEEIRNYLYYIALSTDEDNVRIVKTRIKKMKKADKYYSDLLRYAKKDIRKNGYPWEYQTWR